MPPVPVLGTTALPHTSPNSLLLTLREAARRPHETDQVCLGLDRCSQCVQMEAAASALLRVGPLPAGHPARPRRAGAAAALSRAAKACVLRGSSVACVSCQSPGHGQASLLGHGAQHRRAGTVRGGLSQPAAQHGTRGRWSCGGCLDVVPCCPAQALGKATLGPVPRAPLWLLYPGWNNTCLKSQCSGPARC